MIERKVSTVEVEDLLTQPDGSIKQSNDKVIAYKNIAGREDNLIAVVVVDRNKIFDVVTVMVNFEEEK